MTGRRARHLATTLTALTVLVAASVMAAPAEACSPPSAASHFAFELDDEAGADAPEPPAVGLTSTRVARGGEHSCYRDDIGFAHMTVEPFDSEFGYLYEVTDPPPGLDLPDEPIVPGGQGGELMVKWDDVDTTEPVSFSMTVTAVNAEGVMGPRSEPVHFEHEGTMCSLVTAASPATAGFGPLMWLAALLGLGAAMRRAGPIRR